MRHGSNSLGHEITEILNNISNGITDLILEYGLPVARIEGWVDDAIETAEALGLARAAKEGPAE